MELVFFWYDDAVMSDFSILADFKAYVSADSIITNVYHPL